MAHESVDPDKIACLCMDFFNNLPKKGKPTENEWTVLSCILKHEKGTDNMEVVSLGTGSKCIGANKMSPNGDRLNDSHAEIMARRGFLVYLYYQIELASDSKYSIFEKKNCKYSLKNSIEFIFYASQLPCGDASIIPKEVFIENKNNLKRSLDFVNHEISSKMIKLYDSDIWASEYGDVHRTGAKCLTSGPQDPKGDGHNFHILSHVRTKPGRGDPTMSVSCSDKMARWIHVGIQGALLSLLLNAPIFISKFVYGAGVPFSLQSLERAYFFRSKLNNGQCKDSYGHKIIKPNIEQSTFEFQFRKMNDKQPSPCSMVWYHSLNSKVEVAIAGKPLGVTKKNLNKICGQLSISKYRLFNTFMRVLNRNTTIKQELILEKEITDVTYKEMKDLAVEYQRKWLKVKEEFFGSWTQKPNMWIFSTSE